MMRVSISIAHPAHYHMFRHLIDKLVENGVKVEVLVVEKDVNIKLLEKSGLEYIVIGKKTGNLALDAIFITNRLIKHYKKTRPDLVIDRGLCNIACVLLDIPHIVIDDDGLLVQRVFLSAGSSMVVTPPGLGKKYFSKKHIELNFLKELAYLNPGSFRAKKELTNITSDKYIIIRWVSLDALHDTGITGLTEEVVTDIIKTMEGEYDFYISSENPLPNSLKRYEIPTAHENLHHALAYASLLITDSQTVTKEAVLLGTPTIRSNGFVGPHDFPIFNDLQDRYGILKNVSNSDAILVEINKMLEKDTDWIEVSNRINGDYVDLSDYLLDITLEFCNNNMSFNRDE